MKPKDFYVSKLSFPKNLFSDLTKATEFESLGKGRWGNNLVKPEENRFPIVRTTTAFTISANSFSELHQEIINGIDKNLEDKNFSKVKFNHALIEIYDAEYRKMKYHSDQALDLATNSYISLFSCYEYPEKLNSQNTRILRIKDKITEKETDIPLTHNSLVLFSTDTNSRFFHKIIFPEKPQQKESFSENRWLGITFRTSKTFIQFKKNTPYFENGKQLILANEIKQKQFYTLRGKENKQLDFTYPELNFTLSKADTFVPKNSTKKIKL
ncbi:alpha-ketoglutarate-dependent dioxygenase AlkB [Zunongwangia sp. HRR-M8]|uniref:alpha-ketoglutarate-dependent dioxygenase AlkB n=1 Tax=Zunongwangia sp. HRR-M8 TaxID=3015170 RepID=UPI0022DE5ED2|nr:alpha-ketoglutarate-dependent dioxygenase AlkB [Zunongwangia sp. HRR-M8]WBL21168.1 alpha-ketoglutarate-dependent dioxygenase AlkB [Zunongwangia sp. HRR-M8]